MAAEQFDVVSGVPDYLPGARLQVQAAEDGTALVAADEHAAWDRFDGADRRVAVAVVELAGRRCRSYDAARQLMRHFSAIAVLFGVEKTMSSSAAPSPVFRALCTSPAGMLMTSP